VKEMSLVAKRASVNDSCPC